MNKKHMRKQKRTHHLVNQKIKKLEQQIKEMGGVSGHGPEINKILPEVYLEFLQNIINIEKNMSSTTSTFTRKNGFMYKTIE